MVVVLLPVPRRMSLLPRLMNCESVVVWICSCCCCCVLEPVLMSFMCLDPTPNAFAGFVDTGGLVTPLSNGLGLDMGRNRGAEGGGR